MGRSQQRVSQQITKTTKSRLGLSQSLITRYSSATALQNEINRQLHRPFRTPTHNRCFYRVLIKNMTRTIMPTDNPRQQKELKGGEGKERITEWLAAF